MNNNLNKKEAYLGVFSDAGYIDVGTKEKPLPYPVKETLHPRFHGRQFVANPQKTGSYGAKHPEVYLDKTHNWLLEGVPYVDRVKYAEAQPEKPKRGFGTSDYSKRDEFSMDFRTEQMREALKSEARHQAIASEKAKAAMEKELAASGYTKGTEANEDQAEGSDRRRSRKPLLYDSVFDGEDAYPTAVRDSMIEGRDSKNPTQISWERDFGTMRTSAHSIGHGIDQAEHGKPQFARLPIVESTFYRPQGVPISQGKTVFNSRPQ